MGSHQSGFNKLLVSKLTTEILRTYYTMMTNNLSWIYLTIINPNGKLALKLVTYISIPIYIFGVIKIHELLI